MQHPALAAVRKRNERFEANDIEAVLSTEALRDSATLLVEVLNRVRRGRSAPGRSLHALCCLHFHRCQVNLARGGVSLSDAYMYFVLHALVRHHSRWWARRLPKLVSISAWELGLGWPVDAAGPLDGALAGICHALSAELATGGSGIGELVLELVTASASEPKLVRTVLFDLAGLHYTRFRRSGDPERLRAAIASLEQAVGPCTVGPHDPGPAAGALDLMGTARYNLYQFSGDQRELFSALDYHTRAVEACGDDDDLVQFLDNTGATHYMIANVRNESQHITLALDRYEQAWARTAPGSAQRATVAAKLWHVLQHALTIGGDGACLDRAIIVGQRLADEDVVSPANLAVLAELFRGRSLLGDQPDRASFELLTRAQSVAQEESDDWLTLTINLAAAVATRFENTHDVSDLDRAIELFELARTRAEPGGPERMTAETNLAEVQRRRRQTESLDRAATPALERASQLLIHFEHSGYPALLDEAIGLVETGSRGLADDDPDYAWYQGFHGHLLHLRFKQHGDPDDLVASTERLREAVRLKPDTTAHVAEFGTVLRIRFEQGHGIEHINESIRLQERILPNVRPSSRMLVLNVLGQSLQRRFEHNNYLADLTTAVERLTEAVASEGPDLERAACHNNLGSAHYQMYQRTGAPAALAQAVENHRAAVRISPPTHRARPTRLDNLAGSLLAQYHETGDAALLDKAVRCGSEAVNSTPSGSPELARRLDGLGCAVRLRYEARHNPADLHEAIRHLAAATREVKPGSLHEAAILVSYGTGLMNRFTADRQPGDMDTAIETLERARNLESSLVHDRAKAARTLALATSYDPRSAVSNAEMAFDLLGAVDWHHLPVADQAALARKWTGFASAAADWALAAGEPRRAVELLEHGRGIIWGLLTTRHADLTALTETRPDLAAQLSGINSGGTPGPLTGERIATLNTARKRVLAEIRTLDGFADFLRTPSLPRLAAALAGGPVIYLNVTERGSTALIIRSDLDIDVEPLHGCDLATISTRTREFLDAVRTLQDSRAALLAARVVGQRARKATLIAFRTAIDIVRGTLEWGWSTITEPVLARALGHTADGLPPDRTWWCPTGPLTRFPLHATGYHDRPGHSVIDRTVYSETSTLRMLADTYRKARTPAPKMLAVGAAKSGRRQDVLKGVLEEVEVVRASSPWPTTFLEGAQATRDRVLAELPSHQWFHFAGHANTSISDSSGAALLAADGDISLVDLVGHALTNAELAFLSACHGLDASPPHADEALHLAGAAQAIGFRHVVAARNKIDDSIACRVAADFYRQLHATPDPGVALHLVLLRLRAELAGEAAQDELTDPFAWIHHTHSGPVT